MAKGCDEAAARAAATSTAARGWSARLVASGVPMVRVPVLSNTTVSTSARRSSAVPCLINRPLRNSLPLAEVTTAGTASPRAQGQVMISVAAEMLMAKRTSPPVFHIQKAKAEKESVWTSGE